RRHTRFSRDWSSDVCSSDLNTPLFPSKGNLQEESQQVVAKKSAKKPVKPAKVARSAAGKASGSAKAVKKVPAKKAATKAAKPAEIGRASCRERGECTAGGGA